jgi:nitrite reductase (NADH) small subunit
MNDADLLWQDVGAAADWKPGQGKLVTIGKRRIGVYFVDGAWYALKDVCPHMGAPLHDGIIAGRHVACPLHGWEFDLATGEGPGCSVACYRVKIDKDRVLVGY